MARLQERGRYFLERARVLGLDTGLSEGYAVTPAILGSSSKATKVSQALLDHGINVQPIIYPAVEEKAARLRFFISSMHTEQQIDTALETLCRVQ